MNKKRYNAPATNDKLRAQFNLAGLKNITVPEQVLATLSLQEQNALEFFLEGDLWAGAVCMARDKSSKSYTSYTPQIGEELKVVFQAMDSGLSLDQIKLEICLRTILQTLGLDSKPEDIILAIVCIWKEDGIIDLIISEIKKVVEKSDNKQFFLNFVLPNNGDQFLTDAFTQANISENKSECLDIALGCFSSRELLEGAVKLTQETSNYPKYVYGVKLAKDLEAFLVAITKGGSINRAPIGNHLSIVFDEWGDRNRYNMIIAVIKYFAHGEAMIFMT